MVRALAAESSCSEVAMVNRRAIFLTADPRVRQVILDTALLIRSSLLLLCQISEHGFAGLLGRFESLER